MGILQDLLSPIPLRAEESSNTLRKRGYTVAVQKMYVVPPPSPEDHHKAIDQINTIVQVMQTQKCNLEGLV